MTVESLTAVQLASTQVRICALVVDDSAVLAEPLPVAPVPVEPLPVEPRHLVGLLLGALRVSATERALVLNPVQLISVVTRARIRDELAELAGGQL